MLHYSANLGDKHGQPFSNSAIAISTLSTPTTMPATFSDLQISSDASSFHLLEAASDLHTI